MFSFFFLRWKALKKRKRKGFVILGGGFESLLSLLFSCHGCIHKTVSKLVGPTMSVSQREHDVPLANTQPLYLGHREREIGDRVCRGGACILPIVP